MLIRRLRYDEIDTIWTIDRSEVIHRVYRCTGTAVEFYIVLGGGHAWPGSALSRSIANFVGYTTLQIDASKLDWAFFRRFALPPS